jgi:hypothetical protein
MRVFIVAAVLFIGLLTSFTFAQEEQPQKYAQITGSVVKVHSEISPSSPVIMQIYKGQVFEVIGEGKLWIKVQTDKGLGWVPRNDCRIMDKKSGSIIKSPIKTLIFTLLLFLAIGGTVFHFIRQQKHEEASI